MADPLSFNKIAGAVLATGLLVFGLQNVSAILFEKTPPAHPGDKIAIVEDTSGAEAADVIPDWGTVLPKADIAAGQAVTQKCSSCHQFDPAGTNGTGPGLYGVVGRKPGSHPGYTYDQAMTDFGTKNPAWTYDLLYQFLKAPQGFIPGVKMTFAGLPTPQDRINVIAYLRSNGSTNVPIPAPAPVKPAASNAAADTNAAASNSASNAAVAPAGK
jgi:cytochrome c